VKFRKLFEKILSGSKDTDFRDFVKLVESFGFMLSRVKGSHHIFSHPAIPELINLQNFQGHVKPYQVKQFLKIVEKYNIQSGDE
jgi:predicted RNA binding protein YcfA (HicA-like mRNA interferase family)